MTILVGYETRVDGKHWVNRFVNMVPVEGGAQGEHRAVDPIKDAVLTGKSEMGGAFFIDKMPAVPEPQRYKDIKASCDPKTKAIYYEYEDRPATLEEELGDLRATLVAEETAKAERDTGIAQALAEVNQRLKAIEDKLGIATKG